MLATLVIGLREGLEAALVVGIIAAFLKRNGHSLTAMWWGVGAAVVTSLAVGTGLWVLESALPQAAQEGLETVIGGLAVVFVTGMLVWMSTHARSMKRDLESNAAAALGTGSARALAVMAFLAVLKEGFETSVFLLATFRAAVGTASAATGAVIGILAAVLIGFGIYAGGVRLDLARFFRVTGVFLLLVAAGLTLTAVRTAHEAGWVNGGQQRTVDLSWLAPSGSLQASLVTGVLGIPADPRLIEVVAWFAYLVPAAVVVLLPARLKPTGRALARTRYGLAAAAAGAAVALAVGSALAMAPTTPTALQLSGAGTAQLKGSSLVVTRAGSSSAVRLGAPRATERKGVAAEVRTGSSTARSAGATSLSLDELVAANGGRVPVGVDPARAAGPFTAAWSSITTASAWSADGRLIDASTTTTRVLTVSGGGLAGARTVTIGAPAVVAVAGAAAVTATAAVTAAESAVPDGALWGVQLPLALLVVALLLAVTTRVRAVRERGIGRADLRTEGSASYAVK